MHNVVHNTVTLRALLKSECQAISSAFRAQGWHKPADQYERYFEFQTSGERDIIIAEYEGEFAGYLTINWVSDYEPFKSSHIPEVVDFNVLKKYQRKGIGTSLMDEAEERIKKVSNFAGIGFGLYKDYGAAQILYIKRGYIPDGRGMIKNYIPLIVGETVIINDSLALYLLKRLKK